MYGSFITWALVLGREVEAAGEVRVEDVVAACAEPKLDRLDVDEHVVAARHGTRQSRIRDARTTVHLQTHEAVVPLRDRSDRPAPERHRHCGHLPY